MKVQQVLTTPSSAEAVKKSCVNRSEPIILDTGPFDFGTLLVRHVVW